MKALALAYIHNKPCPSIKPNILGSVWMVPWKQTPFGSCFPKKSTDKLTRPAPTSEHDPSWNPVMGMLWIPFKSQVMGSPMNVRRVDSGWLVENPNWFGHGLFWKRHGVFHSRLPQKIHGKFHVLNHLIIIFPSQNRGFCRCIAVYIYI